jgi:peptide chain release factor 1
MNALTPNLAAKLDATLAEHEQLGQSLEDPAVLCDPAQVRALATRRSAIDSVVVRYRQLKQWLKQIDENQQIVADGSDADLSAMAAEELPTLKTQSGELLESIIGELVTADDRAVGSVILEVRAGTGGAEAALWAGDIFEMYQRYASLRNWTLTVMDFSAGDQGGIRSALASVQGDAVWQGLGYEGGVHCVKRVPATETQGRIHTSTATVAVLPEPEKVQIDIPESDVKIDVTTAQGPGGQNVNKVATAVKMVHIPTGIEVRMQESKSQQQNRARAWQLMRARVFDHNQRLVNAQRAQQRSAMIGSGERSERIRTYRWKENVVVDHRVERSFNLGAVIAGGLEPVVDALIAHDRALRIAAL